MNKNIIAIPEEWRKHRILCFVYWFAHYIAVNYVAVKHFHKVFLFHDIEKPFKILIGMKYEVVSKQHLNKSHHPQGKADNEINWVEAICDWEASGYTKPNSLLNAYETCKKYYPTRLHIVIPLLKQSKLI